MSITVKKLNYVYDEGSPFSLAALKDVSLCIPDGEFVCVIGHTGSGKSTLVQHLNGLLKPNSALELSVDGINLLEKNNIRKHVGMVFQYPEYQLFEQTVFEDIAFGPKNLGFSKEEIEQTVCESMKEVGLDETYRDRSPFELSGGEKRRCAIAGVLAMKPKVLVLDEPVAGLDPKGKQELLAIIKEYHKTHSATVIMISHNMDDLVELADRVIVMHGGEKVLDGTPKEVFADSEKINALSLELPTVSKLVSMLRKRGKDVPPTICTKEELTEFLTGAIK